MTKLTYQQKLDALSYRFYQGGVWTPKAGDFYTTSRADLELYQVVSVEGGVVHTSFTEGTDAISEWPEAGFLTEGFGPRRVFVPEWVICAPPSPETKTEGMPQDVINLVIAAREAFGTGMLPSDENNALDKALEAFAGRVRYENEPTGQPCPHCKGLGAFPETGMDCGECHGGGEVEAND